MAVLRDLFEEFAVTKRQRRDRLRSLVFGVVWLIFFCGNEEDKEKTGRKLRLSTETDEEKRQREEQEEQQGGRSRNNPGWIRDAAFCAKKVLDLEKSKKGPAPVLKKKFPSPTLQDCPAMALALLEIAVQNGLEKETSTDFRKWMSKCYIMVLTILIANSY
jgi:hypothetical protein